MIYIFVINYQFNHFLFLFLILLPLNHNYSIYSNTPVDFFGFQLFLVKKIFLIQVYHNLQADKISNFVKKVKIIDLDENFVKNLEIHYLLKLFAKFDLLQK